MQPPLAAGGLRCCGSGSGSGSRLHLRGQRAAMAYSTVQRVALASGLVLAVSLLLPKAFLSRGKRQEPPAAPEGKRRPCTAGDQAEEDALGMGESG